MAQRSAKTKRLPHRFSPLARLGGGVLSLVLALLALTMTVAGLYVRHSLGLIIMDNHIQIIDPNDVNSMDLPPEEGDVSNVPADNPLMPENYNFTEVNKIPVQGNTANITNIMLLGMDGRTYQGVRSDTMIILSINDATRTIKMISLLRDTAVSTPGRDRNGDGLDDYCKLNASYAYGGFDLLSKTIQQNFRLDIDQYVGVNFASFDEAIDILGGVDIEMTRAEVSRVCADYMEKEWWEKGFVPISGTNPYHLNGYQALQFARIRKIDSDFSRTLRQKKVLEQVFAKIKNMNFMTLNSLLNSILPCVITNISGDELMGYAMKMGTYATYTVDSDFHIPEDGKWDDQPLLMDGGWPLWLTDPVGSVKDLHQWIYG